jgi:hypothetical protein
MDFTWIFIGALIVAIFAFDIARRWWRAAEWRRRVREHQRDSDQ